MGTFWTQYEDLPPVWAFDRAFNCNYMFVNRPPAGTPLELIARLTADQWYLAGYGLFAAGVIALIYLVIHGIRRGKEHGK